MTPSTLRARSGRVVARLLPLLLLLFASLAAGAAEPAATLAAPAAIPRYLAPDGDDRGGANACADPAAPCATLTHALSRALPGDTLYLTPGAYSEANVRIDKPITITGSGSDTTTLDGGAGGALLTVTGGGALTLEALTLRGGAGQRGGAILQESGQLTLRRVVLLDNSAVWGGGVYVAAGTTRIEDSRLAGNTAEGGGAIFAAAGSLTILRSELAGNRAGVGGGLLVGPAAAATLSRTVLTGNEARHGGGVYVQGAFQAGNALWRDNRATGRGGGLFSDDGTTLLEHTGWLNNGAALGGGIAGVGRVRLRNSFVTGSGGGDCAIALTGSNNLLDDASCGLPARPATALDGDGRPGFDSNAIDAVPAGQCGSEAGGAIADDLRGEPRPADGNGDGSARCDIGPYEFQPRLVVVHSPALSDATRFGFGGDLGAFVLTVEQPQRAFELPPGSYRLNEGRKAGWKVTAISCSGDSDNGSIIDLKARAATVDLDAGEAIRCAFSARPTRNSIGIAVAAAEGPVAVAFSGDLGAFALAAPATPDWRTGKLAAGVRAIQATPPAGWRVAGITCAGDSDGGSAFNPAAGTALIDLDGAETIGCVFQLARTAPGARLTIRHEATPADDADFAYTGNLGPFLLRAPSAAQTSYTLMPGIYRVHELLHPLWVLSDIVCSGDADGGSVIAREEATVAVDLDLGEEIACVFRHLRAAADTGTLTLVQAANPPEAATFAYDGTLGAFALALPDNGTRTWSSLPPGSYTVQQTPPAGWQLDAITCAGDSDAGSTLLPAEHTATLDVDAGETLVCTFADSRPVGSGSITIVHAPTPADDTPFRFRGALGGFTLHAPSGPVRTFTGLAAGVYSVNVRLPDGWQLSAITCEGDGDAGTVIDTVTAAAAIDLDLGEAITCRYATAREDAPPPPPTANRIYIPYLGR